MINAKFNDVFHFAITNNCNYKCNFCKLYNKKNKDYLTLNELKNISDFIKYLLVKYNHDEFAIYGGEPILHPELVNFINLFDTNIKIYLITNLSKDYQYFKNFNKKNIDIEATFYIDKVDYKEFFNKVNKIKDYNFNLRIALSLYSELYNDYNLTKKIINYIKDLDLINITKIESVSYNFNTINNNIKEELKNIYSLNSTEDENFFNNKLLYNKVLDCNKINPPPLFIDDDGHLYSCNNKFINYYINVKKDDINKTIREYESVRKFYNKKKYLCDKFCCVKLEI
jgi:MoaA/NifB/PqqE/SkfB family radical SAM enzyme